MATNAERFDGRTDSYSTYRPSYPAEVIAAIKSECSLEAGAVVADIGSGTGIFTRQLLEAGFEVYAAEPNPEMRAAAEKSLKDEPRFHSVAGNSEATTLPGRSVDLVTAAQAFHWFDLEPTKAEFRRILRPGGWVALVWNERDSRSPFQQAYDALFRKLVPEYSHVVSTRVHDGRIESFLDGRPVQVFTFKNGQLFDFDSLLGRMRSSSYAPKPGDPVYDELVVALRSLFDEHQQDGRINFAYETQLFVGQIAAS